MSGSSSTIDGDATAMRDTERIARFIEEAAETYEARGLFTFRF